MGKDESQGSGGSAVDVLGVPFEGQIVGEIQLANVGGVGGAAEILEQQGVIEVIHIPGIELQCIADERAYTCAADAVVGGLPFGQVKRVGQRATDIGKVQCRAE